MSDKRFVHDRVGRDIGLIGLAFQVLDDRFDHDAHRHLIAYAMRLPPPVFVPSDITLGSGPDRTFGEGFVLRVRRR